MRYFEQMEMVLFKIEFLVFNVLSELIVYKILTERAH